MDAREELASLIRASVGSTNFNIQGFVEAALRAADLIIAAGYIHRGEHERLMAALDAEWLVVHDRLRSSKAAAHTEVARLKMLLRERDTLPSAADVRGILAPIQQIERGSWLGADGGID